jgi:ribosomal protein L35AE/L33A
MRSFFKIGDRVTYFKPYTGKSSPFTPINGVVVFEHGACVTVKFDDQPGNYALNAHDLKSEKRS